MSDIAPVRVRAILQQILIQPTAPFAEHAVLARIDRFAADRPGLRLRVDAFGNRGIVYRRGRAAPIAFAAHTDHPGLVFNGVLGPRRGAARFFGGGGLEAVASNAPRTGVVFFCPGRRQPIPARIVGARNDGQRGVAVEVRFLKEPRDLPVGAPGQWDLPAFDWRGRIVHSRALDDLAGVAAMLALLDHLHRTRAEAHVHCLFTRAEEVGFVGALALAGPDGAAWKWMPHGTPIVSLEASRRLAGVRMGGGPILRVGDRKSIFHWAIAGWLGEVAAAMERPDRPFAHQRRLMTGGTCESTAYQLMGWPTGALCVALGNYHNLRDDGRIGAEFIHLDDLTAMADWMSAAARSTASLSGIAGRHREKMERHLADWWALLAGTVRVGED